MKELSSIRYDFECDNYHLALISVNRNTLLKVNNMQLTSDSTSTVPDSESNLTATQHVLVVDDDYDLGESIRIALNSQGFQVSTARDGDEGVAIAEARKPDLLILDMMMPKRSGLLVLERLRQHTDIPVPVIMITGNEGKRHQQYAELLGVNDYLHKPFTMDRLLESVKKLLN